MDLHRFFLGAEGHRGHGAASGRSRIRSAELEIRNNIEARRLKCSKVGREKAKGKRQKGKDGGARCVVTAPNWKEILVSYWD